VEALQGRMVHRDTGCVAHDAEITPVEPALVRTSEGNVR